ncbi:hypothetical protein HMPREF0379_0763 [[Eubacterium] yurii subsp. margaretiae ATCC 43715]|nr:hypothetical protein HMPREF0379_0763 [[Eubacterium] yurii subsp. margaretiae ATCC 43715]
MQIKTTFSIGKKFQEKIISYLTKGKKSFIMFLFKQSVYNVYTLLYFFVFNSKEEF